MGQATVNKVHGFTDPLSKDVMRNQNPDLYTTQMPRMFPIHGHINLFSVAKRSFRVNHVYCKTELKGCAAGERYVKCYSVPDPPQQLSVDAERGGLRVEVEPRDEAGWRTAIDILNPNNPSLDPYFQPNSQQAALYSTGQNVDLIRFGLFPSRNEVPTEEELQRAEKARDASYRKETAEAMALRSANPQAFPQWLDSHPDVGTAMDALGLKAEWHNKEEMRMECPNCGSTVKAGIAYHIVDGKDCIIDWKRAYEAGRIKMADVPESKRWDAPRKSA